jgi:hypothetical protein
LANNPITLEYSINNGTDWNIIAQNISNSGNYTWTTPNISSASVQLRMKAID